MTTFKTIMSKNKKKQSEPVLLDQKKIHRRTAFRRNLPLFIMLIIPLAYYAVFHYGPMFGLVMAFQNYRLKDGLLGSEWVGLMNFKMIFNTPNMVSIIWNTLKIGILTVFVSFPFPIILAIMLNEISNKIFKKISQTILYLPHFFSWVILGGIVIIFFSFRGPVNSLIAMLGFDKIGFLTEWNSWLAVYLGTGIWKEMGYDAIIYLAALTSIEPSYYEAAKLDGANKWQQITRITLPCLMPTIIMMFILAIGKVSSVGFDRIYVMSNDAVAQMTNVVSVFNYEMGVRKGYYSISTAMGLFDSVLSLILVMFTNWLARKNDSSLF